MSFKHKKKYGQNFLTDQNTVLQKIMEVSHIKPHEEILEIGPGEGAWERLANGNRAWGRLANKNREWEKLTNGNRAWERRTNGYKATVQPKKL